MIRGVMILALSCVLLLANSFAQKQAMPSLDLQYPESLNVFLFHQQDSLDLNSVVSSHKQFRKLIQQLRKKLANSSSEENFLKELFYHVHSKKLKYYNKYAVMQETLEDGTYGCLTGTALYAVLLSAFEYDYDIIELPNHVFLQVKGNDGYYIFESTLPQQGFKKLAENIVSSSKQLVEGFRKPITKEVVGDWYGAKEIIDQPFNLIGLKELAGLQHFNEAVKLCKKESFEEAIDRATEAYKLYPSIRKSSAYAANRE